jgi:hypothetical protein
MADLDLANKHATLTADTEFLVLNPVLYTDAGTGSFFYDLFLKSTSEHVTAKWQLWNTAKGGGAGYEDITGAATAANSFIYKANVELDATSIGKIKIDYTSAAGTPTLEYWYALRGPGLPTSLQRQGSGTGAYSREFFLHADKDYTFTSRIASPGGSVYFTWKYYNGNEWIAYANGTDSSFVATPPTSGRVRFDVTTAGSEASSWSFKAKS